MSLQERILKIGCSAGSSDGSKKVIELHKPYVMIKVHGSSARFRHSYNSEPIIGVWEDGRKGISED